MIAKGHLIIFYVISLITILGSPAFSEAVDPGLRLYKADSPVSPEQAKAYYSSKKSTMLKAASVDTPYTTEISPEIRELARALHNDPYLIYNYVHNHIDYVPYYGTLKGPTLTYLDGSGNDFDQASLMVALLRASGYTNVSYIYGTRALDQDVAANWLGITNSKTTDIDTPTLTAIISILSDGGIPFEPELCKPECLSSLNESLSVCSNNCKYMIKIDRVWVRAEIDNIQCDFDPAFKTYNYLPSKIGEMMSYDQYSFLATAANLEKGFISNTVTYLDDGKPIGEGVTYIQNLSETDMTARLKEYSSSLIEQIRTNHAAKDVKELVGGRSIIQEDITECKTLSYATATQKPWSDVPDEYIAKIKIK